MGKVLKFVKLIYLCFIAVIAAFHFEGENSVLVLQCVLVSEKRGYEGPCSCRTSLYCSPPAILQTPSLHLLGHPPPPLLPQSPTLLFQR